MDVIDAPKTDIASGPRPGGPPVIGEQTHPGIHSGNMVTVEFSPGIGYWLSLHPVAPGAGAPDGGDLRPGVPGAREATGGADEPKRAIRVRNGDLRDSYMTQVLTEASFAAAAIYCRTPEVGAALQRAWEELRFADPRDGVQYRSADLFALPVWRWGERPPYEPPPPAGGRARVEEPAGGRGARFAPLVRNGLIRCPSDRIHKAVVEALAPEAIRSIPDDLLGNYGPERFWRAHLFDSNPKKRVDVVHGLIGFRHEPEPAIWKLLKTNPALAIKAQYALWARAYAETDGAPGVFVPLTLPQFCDDLGFVRHHSGAHRPERKREALKVLRLLTGLEIHAVYVTPQGHAHALRGPLWRYAGETEPDRACADAGEAPPIDRSSRKGGSSEPLAFHYAPGPYFEDETWRQYNRRVALVGEGLLRLRGDIDRWAIAVCGYLVTRARMNSYAPLVVRVATLLAKTGLENDRTHPGRAMDQMERALDRGAEEGILGAWEYTQTDTVEPDMDDYEELASLWLEARDRRHRSIVVHWPAHVERRRATLEEKRSEARALRRK